MLELAAAAAVAWATPSETPGRPPSSPPALQVVAVMDNGVDDAAFYRREGGPSVAQALVDAIAVAAGAHPRVFTLHARGEVPAGGVHEVAPLRAGCVAPGSAPTDRCWCGPGEDCWSALGASAVAGDPDAAIAHASAVRGLLGDGPRLELHVGDLHPAPGPGDPPCVTEGDAVRAVGSLMDDPAPLDHLAVGLLRVPLTPGPDPAPLSRFERVGRCLTAAPAWAPDGPPLAANLAVLVLGYRTAGADEAVAELLDALASRLDGGARRFELARLRGPVRHLAVSARDTAAGAADLRLLPTGRLPALPCVGVRTFATFVAEDGLPVPVTGARGDCAGVASLAFAPGDLRAAFLGGAGLDPRVTALVLRGEVVLRGDEDALRSRFLDLGGAAGPGRPLPTLPGLSRLWFPADGGASRARPWETRIHVEPLVVDGVDPRPWGGVVFGAVLLGALGGMGCAQVTHRLHASRALRRHWDASLAEADDPRLQRPIAAVLGAAQVEVARAWPLRVAFSAAIGLVTATGSGVALLSAWRWLHA